VSGGRFSFLYVQIANFKAGGNAEWPEVREAQLETLSLRNTGMAVTIDIGNPDNIHPTNKQDVGKPSCGGLAD
jgi:sialate O-acetylesterase